MSCERFRLITDLEERSRQFLELSFAAKVWRTSLDRHFFQIWQIISNILLYPNWHQYKVNEGVILFIDF